MQPLRPFRPPPLLGEAFCFSLLLAALFCSFLLFSAFFCFLLKLPVLRQVAGVVEFIRCHVVAADAVAQAQEGRYQGPAETEAGDAAQGFGEVEVVDAEGAQEEGQEGRDQPFFVDLMAQFRRNRRKGSVCIGIEAVGCLFLPAGERAFQGRCAAAARFPLAAVIVDAVGFEVMGHERRFAVDVGQFGIEDLGELFFIGFVELAEELLEPLLRGRHLFRLQAGHGQFLIFPDHVDGPVLIVVDKM